MRPPTHTTVLLVDDHQLLADTLTSALNDIGVPCSQVAPMPLPELVDELIDRAPELVLLDLNLGPFGDSAGIIPHLVGAEITVIALTSWNERGRATEALEAGARRVISKSADFTELVSAVRDATSVGTGHQGPRAVPPPAGPAAHRPDRTALRAPFQRLTEREQQTLIALARGYTVREIATRWVIAPTTVRSHVSSILTKLGARSQLQAVVRAVQAGWVDPEDTCDEHAAASQAC